MFAIVRLIDSQEHQYPNKNLIQRSKKKPIKNPESNPDKRETIQDPEKDRVKPMFLKTVRS